MSVDVCREKLEDDEEFELIGDISDALQTDNMAANGNDLRNNDGLSSHCYYNIISQLTITDVTKFKFEYDNIRTSNIFNRLKIQRMT